MQDLYHQQYHLESEAKRMTSVLGGSQLQLHQATRKYGRTMYPGSYVRFLNLPIGPVPYGL